jgi:hypothetical protein
MIRDDQSGSRQTRHHGGDNELSTHSAPRIPAPLKRALDQFLGQRCIGIDGLTGPIEQKRFLERGEDLARRAHPRLFGRTEANGKHVTARATQTSDQFPVFDGLKACSRQRETGLGRECGPSAQVFYSMAQEYVVDFPAIVRNFFSSTIATLPYSSTQGSLSARSIAFTRERDDVAIQLLLVSEIQTVRCPFIDLESSPRNHPCSWATGEV